MKWVYQLTESSATHKLYTVGFYDPSGNWHSESDWNYKNEAADRCAFLNGEIEKGGTK